MVISSEVFMLGFESAVVKSSKERICGIVAGGYRLNKFDDSLNAYNVFLIYDKLCQTVKS